MSWIAVDLDGTLAQYHGWQDSSIGAPIPAMVARVKQWLADGKDVRIFTARAGILDAVSPESLQRADREFAERQVSLIEEWCEQHIGRRLPVTASKDFMLIEIWDDRCVQLRMNTGETINDELADALDRLADLHKLIKLQKERTLEAAVLYQQAHGRPDTEFPDLGELVGWLVAERSRLLATLPGTE